MNPPYSKHSSLIWITVMTVALVSCGGGGSTSSPASSSAPAAPSNPPSTPPGNPPSAASLTSPANGATNVDPWVPFTWTAVPNAQSYVLWIGTSAGASDVYKSAALTTTSSTVTGLLQNKPYFARLITQNSGGSSFSDSTFTTGLGQAHLTSPLPGATNVDPFQAFTWNNVPGATSYYIYVGTKPGASDIFNSNEIAATITSRLASGMLGGQTYNVTMWTLINKVWYNNSGTFSTATQPLPADQNAFRSTVQQQTGNVRLMTTDLGNTPTPGTPLAQVVTEDGRTTATCAQFSRTLAQQLMGQRITSRVRSLTFDGTIFEAHAVAEYWDPFLQEWLTADPTFGLVYWNGTSGLSTDDIAKDVAAKNWSAIQPFILYTTNNKEAYSFNYYMDPILMYLNPIPMGGSVTLPLPNSPVPYLTVDPMTDVGKAGNWLFSFANQTDTLVLSDPVLGKLNLSPYCPIPFNGGPPTSCTIYSQSVNLSAGWFIVSAPSGLQINTMNRYLYCSTTGTPACN